MILSRTLIQTPKFDNVSSMCAYIHHLLLPFLFLSILPPTTSISPNLFKRYYILTCPHNHRTLNLHYPPGSSANDFTNLDALCRAAGCDCFPFGGTIACNPHSSVQSSNRGDAWLYVTFSPRCMDPRWCSCQNDGARTFNFADGIENEPPDSPPLHPNIVAQGQQGGRQGACLAGQEEGWCIPGNNGCCDEYTCVPHESKSLAIQFGIKVISEWLYGSCLSDKQ
ncbi:MAG: hypothetical protein M1836_005018 [Candelina mexicana]|nr:MAG: hypothetical protein M1836_005018 [Candelina mexicana]